MKIEISENGTEKWYFDVSHIGEDPDFRKIPTESNILKKTSDGCSSACLENPQNVLLLVPSIILVTSKVRQYNNTQFDDSPETSYPARERFQGEVFGVWGGVTTREVEDYVSRCRYEGSPIKIIGTYEALMKCEPLLDSAIDVLAIDEADCLGSWAGLKASSRKKDNKSDAVTHLLAVAEEYREKVCFFSATTMGAEYEVEFLRSLRQIEIITPPHPPITPILMERNHPFAALKREVILPILRHGSVRIHDREFTKALIFINSVNQILKICRETELPPEDVGIICGDTNYNNLRTQGYNLSPDLGNTPRFMFLTSSGMRGIDIHDAESINIIVSSTSRAYYMISPEIQLEQAIARNRDRENRHRDCFLFIYDVNVFSKTEEELKAVWESTRERYLANISLLNKALEESDAEYQAAMKTFSSDKGFVKYVNFVQGRGLELNENLFRAQLYRILEVRHAYTKGFGSMASQMKVNPIEWPAPPGGDPCSFTKLLRLMKQGEALTEEQLMSDNYRLIERYHEVFGKYPTRQNQAQLKLQYAADNMSAQYVVDMVSPFEKGRKYTPEQIQKHMQRLFRNYGLEEKTDMPTLISVLRENKVEFQYKKSGQRFYICQQVPDINPDPLQRK